MFRVIQWASIVMCWVATGMNIYAMIRLNRCRKWYEEKLAELRKEVSDERNVDDNGCR